MKPLHVLWASSEYGVWDPRTKALRKSGRLYPYLYVLTLEVT